jgi:hypothetical protein
MTMMAEGWKGLMWFVTGVAVALGLLLVPLEVAAQRKQLDKTLGDIADTQRDIRSLQTEFDTRSNLAQLEKWNGDTLGLSSPTPAQYVSDENALAAIDVNAAPVPGQPGIRTAALIIPTIPGVMPTHERPSDTAPSSVAAPAQVIAASAPVAVAAQRADTGRVAAAIAHVTVPHARPQTVAMLDRKLLSDSTLGDILSHARVEARTR